MAFCRKLGRQVTAETLKRALGISMKESASLLERMVRDGVLGPRGRSGHLVLPVRSDVQQSFEPTVEPEVEVRAPKSPVLGPALTSPVKASESSQRLIAIASITRDAAVQPRSTMSQARIKEFAALMKDGVNFPPVVLFAETDQHVLSDGFHRVAAAEVAGLAEIAAEVRRGSVRDAVLYALAANTTHGLVLSRQDKRQAALKLLADAEWGLWSNEAIARRCGLSSMTISRIRAKLDSNKVRDRRPRKYRDRRGRSRTMNTAKLGSV